jgi:catechol 2,3-dioxygenase-like lactoylglutathione lyase family enzyme
VIQWLLDSDPSIRWQVMRDLIGAPAHEVAVERARVATEGWGARLLALQLSDGSWAGAAFNQGLDSTMHVLSLLRELGLDPAGEQARRAVDLVRDHVTWRGWDWDGTWRGWDFAGTPFFAGEVEPCINGQVAASGAYFGQDVRRIIDRLLGEQLPDGGWNCEASNGSTRSSFNTTICVLEALLEHELRFGRSPEVNAARLRGQEYLLERRLFRRRSTGAVIEYDRKVGPGGTDGQPAWTRFAFPTWWHYDVLRGLEYLRRAGVAPDERMAEAIDLVASKRDGDGRWPLEVRYPGHMPVEIDGDAGRPSRWNTLRALRVLNWYAAGDIEVDHGQDPAGTGEHRRVHSGSRTRSAPSLEGDSASHSRGVRPQEDAMRRTWTIIGVGDVPGSFKWYQSLLGLPETAPAHGDFGQILDSDGTVLLCLHKWGAHEHPSLMSPDHAQPGNGLLLFFRVDDFDMALLRARALIARLEEEPHVNPSTGTTEFTLRDPDGYYVTISALSAA